MSSDRRIPFSLLLVLGLTMMLGPFSLDTYLPAFPDIAESLAVDQQAVSLTVSVYIAALALGQLLGGALSDQFGRKKILVTGLVTSATASLILAFSESLAVMLVARALQAFGAGWALVSVPALVRDRVDGAAAARLFSVLGLILIIAPAIAPSIGSILLRVGEWPLIFFFLAAYALLLIPLLSATIFRAGSTQNTPAGLPTSLFRRYFFVFAERRALPFLAWQAACFSVMMLFITYSSYIYQIHFDQSAEAFSLLFAANIVAMMAFNISNRLLLNKLAPLTNLRLATLCHCSGIALLVAVSMQDGPLWAFLPAMMLTVGALGAVTPNIQACFLDYFPTNAGTAAALLGAAQWGIAGLVSAVSALLPHTLPAIVLAMAACGVASIGLAIFFRPRRPPTDT